MKVLFAACLLAVSAVAVAETKRDIYDIMYLPNAGTSYGFSQAEYQTSEAEVANEDVETKGYKLLQTLGHSFSDKLSLQLTLNYVDLKAEMLDEKDYKRGLSEPTVEARYRLMDESLRFDLLAGIVLGGVSNQEQENNGNSNNKQGGISLMLGTQIGQKLENFQWAGLVQLRHNFQQSVDESNVTSTNDAYNELLVRGDILNKLAEKSFFRTFASANFAQEFDNPRRDTTAAKTVMTVGTEYEHLCTENFLARAGVDYNITNQNTGTVEDNTGWAFRVGANYQF